MPRPDEQPPAVPHRILLIGMIGAGKTTVGRRLAELTGWPYLDNDELVVAATGRAAPALWAAGRVDALHAAELMAFRAGLARETPIILGVAGWIVTEPEASAALREAGFVVWLRATPETLLRRIGTGEGRRSDAGSGRWVAETAEQRAALYAESADLVVDVDTRTATEIADTILAGAGLS